MSEDGSSECLFIRLSDWYAPQAYFSDAGKVGKSALGRPQPPFVCPIGRLQGRYPVATEFPLGRWPLVIGAEGILLRLTALVLRAVSFLGGRKQSVFHRRRQLNAEIRFACPFNRATAEVGRAARRRSDARRILLIQWQLGIKFTPDRLGKQRGTGVSPAAFWLLCRRGQSNPCRGTEYPQTAWKTNEGAFGGTIRRQLTAEPASS